MTDQPDPAELLQRTASEDLLDETGSWLPEAMGRPPALSPSPARRRLVGAGAAMTGLTLLGGLALIVVGIVDALAGGFGALALVSVIIGAVLVSTHWGWVHVAEFTANSIDARRDEASNALRGQWLEAIEPYTRYEVLTTVEADGSITIATVRHQPVAAGSHRFAFSREVVASERHPEDTPAAEVTERAEQLRRQAALLTEQARSAFQEAAAEREHALIGQKDEEERLQARRAASEALAQQINANLRDPPLTE